MRVGGLGGLVAPGFSFGFFFLVIDLFYADERIVLFAFIAASG